LKVIVALDIGATWTRAALFSWEGGLLVQRKFKTPRDADGWQVSSKILGYVIKTLDVLGDNAKPASIGVAVFGPIDYSQGGVVNPPNHPSRFIPLRRPLEDYFDVPITIVNDAVAGVWSEYVVGTRMSVGDLVHAALGTGIGVGVIVGGRLLLGRRGDSHEAGHIVLDPHSSIRCGCGGVGHWEAHYRQALESGRRGTLQNIVASGIASLVACYDPEVIVLSGGVVESGLINIDRLAKMVGSLSFENRIPIIRIHSLGSNGNLYGAYLVARRPVVEVLKLNGW
jgi:predicted NBD/HSP70 family sugar kinase